MRTSSSLISSSILLLVLSAATSATSARSSRSAGTTLGSRNANEMSSMSSMSSMCSMSSMGSMGSMVRSGAVGMARIHRTKALAFQSFQSPLSYTSSIRHSQLKQHRHHSNYSHLSYFGDHRHHRSFTTSTSTSLNLVPSFRNWRKKSTDSQSNSPDVLPQPPQSPPPDSQQSNESSSQSTQSSATSAATSSPSDQSNPSETSSQSIQTNPSDQFAQFEQPLLLTPTAPLAPLLQPHLSSYSLPPLTLGVDDYRPHLPKGQRIVAIGDVHGDMNAMKRFLVAAGVIDRRWLPEDENDDNNTNDDNNDNGANGDNADNGDRRSKVDGANGANGANGSKSMEDLEEDFSEIEWIGGTTIIVQTGDILDRGGQELGCFRLLAHLARQAEQTTEHTTDGKATGKVYILYGNHESLNAAGLFQYAFPSGNAEFEHSIGRRIDYNFGSNRWRLQFAGNEPSRWASFEPGGILGGTMMSQMCVSVVLGRSVFVHGGLRGGHLREYRGMEFGDDDISGSSSNSDHDDPHAKGRRAIANMNQSARSWILNASNTSNNKNSSNNSNTSNNSNYKIINNNWGEYSSVSEVIASAQHRAKLAAKSMPDCLGGGIGSASPVWMREYSQPSDGEVKDLKRTKEMIDDALKETGPTTLRMIMGHTPQTQINAAIGGKAWRIDVGASEGVMGGTPEVLEIIHMGGEDGEDVVSVLTVDGRRIDGRERMVVDNVLF